VPFTYALAASVHAVFSASHSSREAPYGIGYSHSPSTVCLSNQNRTVVPPVLLTCLNKCSAHGSSLFAVAVAVVVAFEVVVAAVASRSPTLADAVSNSRAVSTDPSALVAPASSRAFDDS
jgi:hypothetical protein